jgi:hypothetical protein
MIEKATNRDLTSAFQSHQEETEKQIGRLEQAFQLWLRTRKGRHVLPLMGPLKEANDVAGECDNKKVLDAALIAAAQAVEPRPPLEFRLRNAHLLNVISAALGFSSRDCRVTRPRRLEKWPLGPL